MSSNSIFLFSVDLEDVRENVVNGHTYKDRVCETTFLYLNWLKKTNSCCTFFCVGKVAEQYPELIKEIAASGHELACHTYSHIPLDKLGKENFKKDLDKNINALLKAGANSVKGFRAPVFSLTKSTSWAYDVLSEFGFSYSSSVLPADNPLYGWKEFGETPKKVNDTILELPVTVAKFGPMVLPLLGGVYFRVLPEFILLNRVKKHLKTNRPVLSYFHPYDADTEQEKFMHSGINNSRFYNYLMYYNRKNVFNRLNGVLNLGLQITTYQKYISTYLNK